ncbi:Mpp10 protein, partial [Suhomyces tanzawaensis NRRL Y-17324]
LRTKMAQDLLEVLLGKPQDIFTFFRSEESDDSNEVANKSYFNELAKQFLDPITKQYSVLDEIYVDGLDSTQVFGQTKMVLDGVDEALLTAKIPELKEKFQDYQSDEIDSEDENDEGNDIDESDQDEQEEEEAEEEVDQEEPQLSDDDVKTLNEDFEGFDEENEEQDSGSEAETQVPSDDEIIQTEQKKDAFGLNDGFFDIDQFNKQILALEKENDDEDEEEIDYFAGSGDDDDDDDEEEDEEDMAYYDDFYDKPGVIRKSKSQVANEEELDNEEEEDEAEDEEYGRFNEEEYDTAVGSAMNDLFADEDQPAQAKSTAPLSSYEKQQQEIQAEIAKLEAELVADKKWTMKGEVQAKHRPQDSLLDDPETATLDFDRTSKPVPIITEEVTESLEELIRRRIKSDEFNDLPRRIITDISKFHNKQKFELSEQKSNKSLAELYEDDYNKVDAQKEVSEEVQKQHDEISDLFTKLNHRLDSLCSAHYIPKPHQFKTIEIKVNDNAAAITMEDAQPLHVSSESALAPQEIYKIGDDKPAADGNKGRSSVQLKSGLSFSKDELSREDKQRLRRASKRKRSKEFNQRKELQEQRAKQESKPSSKRQKVGDVVDTLSKAKNVTVIGKKGEMTDVKGNLKKTQGPQTSNNFKL